MPDFDRGLPPPAFAAVGVLHGRLGELRRIDVIEASDFHRYVGTADRGDVTALEGTHTAVPAEQVLALAAAKAILGQRVLAGQQPECLRLDEGIPVAGLGANGAVALARALREIDVGFESHRAAVAAAV